MGRKIFYTAIKTIKKLRDPYYQGAAAELGFYFIFSIIPIITILIQLLGFFDRTKMLFGELMQQFSENAAALAVLSSASSTVSGFSIAFLVVALWSASKVEFSMIRMANYSYKTDEGSNVSGYFKSRLRAVITILGLILMIVISLVVLVYGNLLLDLADSLLREILGRRIIMDRLFAILRWPVALIVYWFFLAINYAVLPNRPISIKKTIPGSLFAAAGILIATAGYYIYFQNFSNLNMVYGSLAAIIALLLWFYWLSYILMVGMVINVEWFEDDMK